MESIVLFGTADDLTCASQSLADVTELHNEAITVQTMAPLEAHVATFALVALKAYLRGQRAAHSSPTNSSK